MACNLTQHANGKLYTSLFSFQIFSNQVHQQNHLDNQSRCKQNIFEEEIKKYDISNV